MPSGDKASEFKKGASMLMGGIYIGTSGFSYPEWKGRFYPPQLKSGDLLGYYASHFNSVEINNTFYRLPADKTLESWQSQVGPGFRFAVKANQKITHRKDGGIAGGDFELFLARLSLLGDQLGPILFQFPASFRKSDSLVEFLQKLQELRSRYAIVPAIELRSKELLKTDSFKILKDNCINLCLNDAYLSPAEWFDPPEAAYLRLRNGPYGRDFLGEVAAWLSRWVKQGLDCYVFFKHEVEAPALAKKLMEIMKQKDLLCSKTKLQPLLF